MRAAEADAPAARFFNHDGCRTYREVDALIDPPPSAEALAAAPCRVALPLNPAFASYPAFAPRPELVSEADRPALTSPFPAADPLPEARMDGERSGSAPSLWELGAEAGLGS